MKLRGAFDLAARVFQFCVHSAALNYSYGNITVPNVLSAIWYVELHELNKNILQSHRLKMLCIAIRHTLKKIFTIYQFNIYDAWIFWFCSLTALKQNPAFELNFSALQFFGVV